jgi:hypothetical protein
VMIVTTANWCSWASGQRFEPAVTRQTDAAN